MIDDSTQYIARISYGKDSLKMLDVIKSRGLPLDRITTTDVWATDTIPANLPPMMAFKERMDQLIWSMYHIEVEHLCAFNKDGTKRTYEQMFYHVPVRKNSQSLNVEREREPVSVTDCSCRERERERQARNDTRIPGSMEPVVSSWTQTECLCTEFREILRDSPRTPSTTGARSSRFHPGTGIKGWPLSNKRLQWCQHLKTRVSTDFRHYGCLGAGEDSKSNWVRAPFRMSAPRGAKTEISLSTWVSLRMSQNDSGS